MSDVQPTPVERPPVEETRRFPQERPQKPQPEEELWWYDENLIRRIIERVKRL